MTPRKVLAGGALVVLVSMAGCSPDNRPRLLLAADPSIATSLSTSNMRPDESFSFGSINLCVSAPATASITGVTIHQAQGDVRVEAFAIRPNPIPSGGAELGGQKAALVAYDSGFAPAKAQQVSGACPKDLLAPTAGEAAAMSELGVQVRLASGDIGGGSALDVKYRIDQGPERTAAVPFGIWLCASTCPPGIGASPSPSG